MASELMAWTLFLAMLGELAWSEAHKTKILKFYGINTDVLKLKGRVESLEKSDGEVKDMLTTLLTAVNDVKLLLATHGIK